jgi:hypothetical protein
MASPNTFEHSPETMAEAIAGCAADAGVRVDRREAVLYLLSEFGGLPGLMAEAVRLYKMCKPGSAQGARLMTMFIQLVNSLPEEGDEFEPLDPHALAHIVSHGVSNIERELVSGSSGAEEVAR